MFHFNSSLFPFRISKLCHFVFVFLLTAQFLLFSGCATTRRRDDVIVSTLQAQNILLERLEEERAGLRQSKASKSDLSFRNAERHLNVSIKALKASNEAITKALSEK